MNVKYFIRDVLHHHVKILMILSGMNDLLHRDEIHYLKILYNL